MTVNGVSPGARIVVEDALKSFGSGARQVHAFGPACLSVEPGEFISVLGPSGCGKSTLILMIAGLLDPTAGRITLDDKDVEGPRTLLLDEPLGKLDAMTREAIRHDLQVLWLERRPTVVLVTHSIEEAVQLSNRVVVVTPRPGRIHSVIAIDLPWPRNLAIRCSAGFIERVAEIQEIFHGYGVI